MREIFNILNFRKEEKQELQEVLKFPIEIFWNLEARWSWPQSALIYIDPSSQFVFNEILCSSNFFFVERQLDVVLKVFQVVGSKFLQNL